MFAFLKKLFTPSEEVTQLQLDSLNYYGKEKNISFKLKDYFQATQVRGGINKFNSIKTYLTKTFLNENNIDRFDLTGFDPIKVKTNELKKQKKDSALKTILEKNLPKQHLDLAHGALGGLFNNGLQTKNENMVPFGTMLYLSVLKNTVKYLVKEKGATMTAEKKSSLEELDAVFLNALNTNNKYLNYQIQRNKRKWKINQTNSK